MEVEFRSPSKMIVSAIFPSVSKLWKSHLGGLRPLWVADQKWPEIEVGKAHQKQVLEAVKVVKHEGPLLMSGWI